MERKWHFNDNDEPVYDDTGEVLSCDNAEDRDAYFAKRPKTFALRIEPTIDHERRAKRLFQYAMSRMPGYGLPPIPCAHAAASRRECYGCGRPIWTNKGKQLCDKCDDGKAKVGFQAADAEFDIEG